MGANYFLDKTSAEGHIRPRPPRPPRPSRRRHPIRRKALTVCIAAIATGLFRIGDKDEEYPIIIGISDRMVTVGDIMEVERTQSKINRITPFIVTLTAGDDTIQAAILNRTESHFYKELAANPRFFSVEEVANLYSQNLISYIQHSIERSVLEPSGLNWNKYYKLKYDKTPKWFEDKIIEVFGDYPFDTETIIAGVDESGAHIFLIDKNGQVIWRDRAGFATIGIGSWHAESQFLFEKHSPSKSYPDTIFLTYVAKQRAEVAPGVGKDTDLCVISLKGSYVELSEELIAFNKVYENLIKKGEKESTKLKMEIIDTLEKTQEARKAKNEKIWKEKMDKWNASGKLGDSPFKFCG